MTTTARKLPTGDVDLTIQHPERLALANFIAGDHPKAASARTEKCSQPSNSKTYAAIELVSVRMQAPPSLRLDGDACGAGLSHSGHH